MNKDEPPAAKPSTGQLRPKVKDLLEQVEMHIAAFENRNPGNAYPEDTIDLDAMSAPLPKVAQAKK